MTFSHKIVWISDLHQTESGMVEGVAGAARLEQAIEQINRWHGDAACCIASGDLTDTGTAGEYAALGRSVAKLSMPFLPMIGNHDNRADLLAAFPPPGVAMPDFMQYRYDIDDLTLLCLDTHVPANDAGALDAERLDWLADALDKAADRRVLVFTHHPPGPLGLGLQDDLRLMDHEPLMSLLSRAPQVEHLFCGHVHRPTSGTINGVSFTTLRAIAHQTRPPHQTWDWSDFVARDERPQYGVILIAPDRVVVQAIDLEDPA